MELLGMCDLTPKSLISANRFCVGGSSRDGSRCPSTVQVMACVLCFCLALNPCQPGYTVDDSMSSKVDCTRDNLIYRDHQLDQDSGRSWHFSDAVCDQSCHTLTSYRPRLFFWTAHFQHSIFFQWVLNDSWTEFVCLPLRGKPQRVLFIIAYIIHMFVHTRFISGSKNAGNVQLLCRSQFKMHNDLFWLAGPGVAWTNSMFFLFCFFHHFQNIDQQWRDMTGRFWCLCVFYSLLVFSCVCGFFVVYFIWSNLSLKWRLNWINVWMYLTHKSVRYIPRINLTFYLLRSFWKRVKKYHKRLQASPSLKPSNPLVFKFGTSLSIQFPTLTIHVCWTAQTSYL